MPSPGLAPGNLAALLAQEKPHLRRLPDDAPNGETPIARLTQDVTPIGDLFVRSNGLIPAIGPEKLASWTLTVDGEVATPLHFDITSLMARFPPAEILAVLECAGNGRSFFGPGVEGLPWGLGAVGCVRWSGVRLRDVLVAAGVRHSAVYAAFESADGQITAPEKPAFSRGLPIEKALSPETLIATHANGEPLPLLHGGPLRIVAPGFPGAAWQKWIHRIWVRDREHDGEKMGGANYRINGAVITDLPVKSLITSPLDGFTATPGEVLTVTGFAWSGHVRVAEVTVSTDGTNWTRAELAHAASAFAWRRFTARLQAASGPMTIMARAVDANGLAQPLDNPPINPKGYGNNRVHAVRGTVR